MMRIPIQILKFFSLLLILVSFAGAEALDNYLQHTRTINKLDQVQADARENNRGIAFIWDDENQDHLKKRAIIAQLCEELRDKAEVVYLPESSLKAAPEAVRLILPLAKQELQANGMIANFQNGPVLLLFDSEVSSFYGHLGHSRLSDSIDLRKVTKLINKHGEDKGWIAAVKDAGYTQLLAPLFKGLKEKQPLIAPIPLVLHHNTNRVYKVFIDSFTESDVTIRTAEQVISEVPRNSFDEPSRARIRAWLETRAASNFPSNELLSLRNTKQVEIRARIIARDGDKITMKREDGKDFEIDINLLDLTSRSLIDQRAAP